MLMPKFVYCEGCDGLVGRGEGGSELYILNSAVTEPIEEEGHVF